MNTEDENFVKSLGIVIVDPQTTRLLSIIERLDKEIVELRQRIYVLDENALVKNVESKLRQEHVRLSVGAAIYTLKPDPDSDFVDEAKKHQKWGMLGQISEVSNSHGLCYRVRHSDDTSAWYQPTELKLQHPIYEGGRVNV